MADYGLWRVAVGVDGIYDSESQTHVGSGFILVSRELDQFCARVGGWATFTLWDELHTLADQIAPNVIQVTQLGVRPYDQIRVFYSQQLGPPGTWGDRAEAYIAPGLEYDSGMFLLALGAQATIIDGLDAYIQFHRTFDGDKDWSLFAGVQVHLGCGPNRPWDFAAPNRIRARQRWTSDTFFLAF
jgi:hypothetical protein